MIMMHSGSLPRDIVVPDSARGTTWRLFIDTNQPTPNDIYPDLDGPFLDAKGIVHLNHHTLVCYVSADPPSVHGELPKDFSLPTRPGSKT